MPDRRDLEPRHLASWPPRPDEDAAGRRRRRPRRRGGPRPTSVSRQQPGAEAQGQRQAPGPRPAQPQVGQARECLRRPARRRSAPGAMALRNIVGGQRWPRRCGSAGALGRWIRRWQPPPVGRGVRRWSMVGSSSGRSGGRSRISRSRPTRMGTISGSNWMPENFSSSPTAMLVGQRDLAVGTAGGHRLVGIGDGQDAGAQRDVQRLDAVRVAGAVEPLVVGADQRRLRRTAGWPAPRSPRQCWGAGS